MIDEAFQEYGYLRREIGGGDAPMRIVCDLACLEKMLVLDEISYGKNPTPEIYKDMQDMVTILQRVKSRAQAFLTRIELGETPALPPSLDGSDGG